MIYIDFQGGAHGNYLEFVCNKILAKIKTNGPTPFNTLGSSHSKKYLEPQVFQMGHYSFESTPIPNNSKVIAVTVTIDDLLLLQSISLLRAGDRIIDPD